MSTDDLRPDNRVELTPSIAAPHSSQRKWWDLLLTKWGAIGMVIFIGLAIGFVEEWSGRLFAPSDSPMSRWEKEQAEEAELRKLDAKAIGQRLVAQLALLPTDDPKDALSKADRLAARYNSKWREEESALLSQLPMPMRQQRQAEQDGQFQLVDSKVNEFLNPKEEPDKRGYNPQRYRFIEPDIGNVVKALTAYVKAGGATNVHYWTNRVTHELQRQSGRTQQMPLRIKQIREALASYKANRLVKDRSDTFSFAYYYVEANTIRRTFPNYMPEPGLAKKQEDQKAEFKTLRNVGYDEGARIFIKYLDCIDTKTVRDLGIVFDRVGM